MQANARDNIPTAFGLRVTQSTDRAATQAARAASPVFRAGRPHALASFAFARLRRSSGAGSAYPSGAPPLKRGTPLSPP